MPSLVGVYRISEYVSAKFLQDAKAGKPVVVRNVNTDARIVDPQRFHKLDIGAELNIPLIIDGEWKFSFTVFHSQPYNWREDEIKLMQELANRIFQKLERTRVEAALRHSESRFRLMVESAKEYAIFTLDLNNIISSWNSGAERLLGYTETEAVGCSGKMIFTPEDKELQKPEQEIKLALTLGRAENERWHVRSDGSRFWGSGLMMPLLSETGNVQGFVKIMQDKTTQRQAHEQIQQQAEQLKQANRIKDEFLAVLSHELRSPLNPILGWSKILQTGKLDKAKTAQGLATIERNAKLQSELIEDLLDVSRILQGKLALNVRPVDLAPIIQAAMETVQLAAQAKSIQIHTNLEPNVGQVSGDANRLQQIVWNLLSNAVKFTSQGGQVNIELRRRPLNNTVNTANTAQIIVSDNGIGIKPEFILHVFDYFRQEDGSTTRRFGGLGLGLAIVRHLIELHGGTVSVESPGEGQGSTFTVTLPLIPNSTETNTDNKLPESSFNLEGIKVLLVDDDSDTREFITFMLSMYGASVTAVDSGAKALATLAQYKPDILVSDIGMPDIDGYMLILQLRTLAPEQGGLLPAIALTAFAGEINQQQALKAGFQRHISKPLEPVTLITAIAELIGT
ncbi:PAS/PAC sensor hybrid histidine kinase [Calothrix sp. PCC 7716]|nr:PAS/PAC sensor hybrid histidine kinase [Calothrix sp. PCC 7716]